MKITIKQLRTILIEGATEAEKIALSGKIKVSGVPPDAVLLVTSLTERQQNACRKLGAVVTKFGVVFMPHTKITNTGAWCMVFADYLTSVADMTVELVYA